MLTSSFRFLATLYFHGDCLTHEYHLRKWVDQRGYSQNDDRSKRRQIKTATNQNGYRSKV